MLNTIRHVAEQPRLPYTAQPRLLDQMRDVIRRKHYSLRTEEAYIDWTRRFVHFCELQHPRNCGAIEVQAFLSHLANAGRVAASTQNQARSALLFLYKEVLGTELPWLDGIDTAKRPARLPVVLNRDEISRVLAATHGTSGLILRLLYGTGMRILEALRLRAKDVDFSRREIVIREGKGFRDRVTMLPETLAGELARHIERVQLLHQADLKRGHGSVYLPYALERKYSNAQTDWGWQYVFPSDRLSTDPRGGVIRRHHADPQAIQRALRDALRLPASQSMRRRTRCATRSRRICWTVAMTSAPCRNCSDTRTYRPR